MKKFLFLMLILFNVAYADVDVIPEFSDETLPIFNEQLRKLDIDEQIKEINELDLRDKKIVKLAHPTAEADAATMSYVDNASGHQSSQAVGTTSGPTTASTSYVDLAEMTITMTTGANYVFVSFSGSISNDTGGPSNTLIIVDIDGTDKAESERVIVHRAENLTDPLTMATSWLELMSAGSHTFKIQWRVTAGTATASGVRRTMQVIEF